MAWSGVITTAGQSLITSLADLTVTRVIAGSGCTTDASAMKAMTVSGMTFQDYGTVESIKAVTVNSTTAGTQFGMKVGAKSGGSYTMKEIGLLATASGTETLIAYFSDSTGVGIPNASTFPDFAYVLSATLAINTSATFTLSVNPNANASLEALEDLEEELEGEIAEKVSISQGSGNAGKFMVVGDDGNVSPDLLVFGGATSGADGKVGLVKQPLSADRTKFLKGDGTWGTPESVAYSAGTGLSLNDTTFSLGTSGVTAGSYGPSAAVSGTDGTTMNVPYITVDSYGRVTSISNKVYTSKNTTYSAGTGISLSSGAFSLTSGVVTAGTKGATANVTGNEGTQIKVPKITVDTYGRVTALTEYTYTSKNTTYDGSDFLPISGGTVTGATVFSKTTDSSSTTTGAVKISGGLGVAKNIYGLKVYNAVWNDIAECRYAETIEPGFCVKEDSDGIMKKTSERLMPGCRLTSDTYGTCMGETDEARTPIAIAGRVLVYPVGDVSRYHLGDAVCSAPDGKIDVMTREEIVTFPERIVGTVSEIPTYDVWYGGSKDNPQPIQVKGRIWVYVR